MIDVLEQDPTPSVVTRPPDTMDTVDTGPVNGTKFHSVQLLVLSQLRIYAKWTQHRHEIKIVLKDHNRLAKTRVLKIIVPTVHPFLSHFTVRSAFRITLYLNSPLLCSKAKCCCHLYWPPITGNMTAVTLALLISPDTGGARTRRTRRQQNV